MKNEIRKILLCDWDPIGCGRPDDEYDSYIPMIYSILRSNDNELIRVMIRKYLSYVENSLMCLDYDEHNERLQLVAKKLCSLFPRNEMNRGYR